MNATSTSLHGLTQGGVFPVRARAKINLRLVVTGRRSGDGYHLLSMVNSLVALHDELVFQFVEDPAVVETVTVWRTPVGSAEIAENLVTSAFRRFWEDVAGEPAPIGMRAQVHKFIPSGAGLGGGSSDAAETLRLLKGLALSSGLAVDETKFQRCALSLGADVPYFLNGGLQLVEGVGERVTQIDTLGIGDVSVALVIPREPVPTPLAYQLFREARPDIPETPDPMRERIVSRGVFAEDPLSALQRLLRNDLQPVVESHFVGVREVVKVLSSLYPDRVLMTGSGACVFVLLREGEVGAFPRTVAGRLPDGTQTILSTLALDNWGSPLANSERLF